MDTTKLKKFTRAHLDLSTGHVTAKDMNLLDGVGGTPEGAEVVPCAPYDFGVMLFILYHHEPEEQPTLLASFREAGFSEAFCNIYALGWEMNVDMIRLDQDTEACEGLPHFDW